MVLPFSSTDEVGATQISELTDVNLSSLTNNDILQYNSSTQNWENAVLSSGATTIDALTDTNITSVANDEILKYNSTSSKWENAVLTAPSYAPTLVVDTVNNRVGVNITPTEDFEVDGNIQINSATTNKIIFNDNAAAHKHAEIQATDDGTNGGQLKFITKIDGLSTLQDNLVVRHNGNVEMSRGDFVLKNIVNATEVRMENYIGLSGYGFVKGILIDNPSDTGANFYWGLRYDAPASSHYCYLGHDPNTSANGRQIVIETRTSGYGVLVITPGNLFSHYNGTGSYLVTTAGGSTSDDRCKFNERDYTEEEALNDIKQLNFKKYKKVQTILTPEEEAIFEAGGDGLANRTDYEKQIAGKPYDEIGLIAQQVPESLKSVLVTEGNDTAMWMVKYDNIIGMCVNCIKNLEKRIAVLEQK